VGRCAWCPLRHRIFNVSDKRKVIPIVPQTGLLFDTAQEIAVIPPVERLVTTPCLRIGTSAFTAAGWPGSFYPANLKPRDYLSYYATRFNTVEIDSTYYATPSASTVTGWHNKTPSDFIFAAKVPQIITHEKVLVGCEKEFEEFVDVMGLLGDKLGPLLLQFPYFDEKELSEGDFLARLRLFLKKLAGTTVRYAMEIRNKDWLTPRLADLLRKHRVALALQDQERMPRPAQYRFDYITADFAYVRLLGDRKDIEKRTKVWDKVIVDRTQELSTWVGVCQHTVRRGIPTYVYANNHYQGHGPATVAQFLSMWEAGSDKSSKSPLCF
jgi:uncharacterized protein YecE (DUF72 family)